MMKISDKQEEMLAFIEDFVMKYGFPPSYEEIRVGLNISSKSLVKYHLEVLESAQLLTRIPNTSRGIRLRDGGKAFQLPLKTQFGAVSTTDISELSQADVLELTFNCVTNQSNLFALSGDTVADEFINDGDIVILQGQRGVKNGELVAIRFPKQKQPLLKRYYQENGHVRLRSASSALEDIIAKPSDVEIQGKVVAVIRQSA